MYHHYIWVTETDMSYSDAWWSLKIQKTISQHFRLFCDIFRPLIDSYHLDKTIDSVCCIAKKIQAVSRLLLYSRFKIQTKMAAGNDAHYCKLKCKIVERNDVTSIRNWGTYKHRHNCGSCNGCFSLWLECNDNNNPGLWRTYRSRREAAWSPRSLACPGWQHWSSLW